MTTNNPMLWAQLIKEAPSGSTLMGGAIIDHIAQVEPKDFDIFHTYHPGLPNCPDHWTYLPRDPMDEAKALEDYGEPGDGPNPIGSVYDYDVNLEGLIIRIQLVGLHIPNPLDHLANFDHSLCLGAYNAEGLFVAAQTLSDLYEKRVTRLKTNNPAKTLERVKKKIKKYDPKGYGDWTLINF